MRFSIVKNCILTTAPVAKSSAHAVVHATRATIAACMSIDVMRRRDGVALGLFARMSCEKNLSYPLTNAMHTMYQDSLDGVSARDCHHRGNGPDASQRSISHSRQCREVLLVEVSRRNPWGCRGGRCRTGHRSRLSKRS